MLILNREMCTHRYFVFPAANLESLTENNSLILKLSIFPPTQKLFFQSNVSLDGKIKKYISKMMGID